MLLELQVELFDFQSDPFYQGKGNRYPTLRSLGPTIPLFFSVIAAFFESIEIIEKLVLYTIQYSKYIPMKTKQCCMGRFYNTFLHIAFELGNPDLMVTVTLNKWYFLYSLTPSIFPIRGNFEKRVVILAMNSAIKIYV